MTIIKSTIPPETSALMLEHGIAVANSSVRPSIWDKMIDLERRLIEVRNAVQWALEVGQVVGGSKITLTEVIQKTEPQ